MGARRAVSRAPAGARILFSHPAQCRAGGAGGRTTQNPTRSGAPAANKTLAAPERGGPELYKRFQFCINPRSAPGGGENPGQRRADAGARKRGVRVCLRPELYKTWSFVSIRRRVPGGGDLRRNGEHPCNPQSQQRAFEPAPPFPHGGKGGGKGGSPSASTAESRARHASTRGARRAHRRTSEQGRSAPEGRGGASASGAPCAKRERSERERCQ